MCSEGCRHEKGATTPLFGMTGSEILRHGEEEEKEEEKENGEEEERDENAEDNVLSGAPAKAETAGSGTVPCAS